MDFEEIVRAKYRYAEAIYREELRQIGQKAPISPAYYEILSAKELGAQTLGIGPTEEEAWEAAALFVKQASGGSVCGTKCPVCGNPCLREPHTRPGHMCQQSHQWS